MLAYDFSFAEGAVKYLETGDCEYLQKVADTNAVLHILNHAASVGNDVPKCAADKERA